MALQTLDISPVGRVEGDLDVRVDITDGVVSNAWTSAELFRGFEIILRDKDPQAGLVVTPARMRHLRRLASDLRRLGAGHRLADHSAAQRHPGAQYAGKSSKACKVSRATSTVCMRST